MKKMTVVALAMAAVICIVESVPLLANDDKNLMDVSSSSSDVGTETGSRLKRGSGSSGINSFSDYPFRGVRYRMPGAKKFYQDDADDADTDDVMARKRRGTYSRKSSLSSTTRPSVTRSYPKRSSTATATSQHDASNDGPDNLDEFISMISGELQHQQLQEEEEAQLNRLADSVALAVLLDQLATTSTKPTEEEENNSGAIDQIKKKKATLKRADKKKKKKRFESLMDRVIGDAADYDAIQEEQDVDTDNDIDKKLLADLAAILAEEGLEQDEIEALLSQLVESTFHDVDDADKKKKKKRSGEWRKLPRGAVRWRSNLVHSHVDADDTDDVENDAEAKFFGRGFHRRLGNGESFSSDELAVAGNPKSARVSAARPIYTMKSKNAVTTHFNHRNSILNNGAADEALTEAEAMTMEMPYATQAMKRMKRSVKKDDDDDVNNNGTVAAPVPPTDATPKAKQEKMNETKQQQQHSVIIRKKSVDWDDYFGIDKKSGVAAVAKEEEGDEASQRNFLDSEYYKSIAGALAYRRKRGGMSQHQHKAMTMKKRTTGVNNQTKGRNDAEDAMMAALRAIQQSAATSQNRQQSYDIDRMKEEFLSEIVEKLESDDLDEMTSRLALQFIEEMNEDAAEDAEANEDSEKEEKRYLKRSINAAAAAAVAKKKSVAGGQEKAKRRRPFKSKKK